MYPCALSPQVPPTPILQVATPPLLIISLQTRMPLGGISNCSTLEEHSPNTPITCSLNLPHIRASSMPSIPRNDLDCSTAVKERKVLLYSNTTDDAVRPLLSKDYSSIDYLNQDILSIAQNLQSSANMHIPAKRKKLRQGS